VSATTFNDVEALTLSVAVANTGSIVKQEVVQLYVHDHEAGLARPVKELEGFCLG